jgi:poly(hydroxyalkanoate) depolymerase family esterase
MMKLTPVGTRKGTAAHHRHAITVLLVFFTAISGLFLIPGQSHSMGAGPLDKYKLVEIKDFGNNPGNLKMFAHLPVEGAPSAPLVVALHGCTQSAAEYADLTQWNKLADHFNFYMVYPQQKRLNNAKLCFNWYSGQDIEKGRGEALSIKQMVDKMVSEYDIDRQNIYITGLSAGGYMTSVLLATYPDIFAGGAVIAGGPYRCATNVIEAISECMQGNVDKTPEQWGDLVRNASGNSGPFPILSIFHGDQDTIVRDSNMDELVEQWTNVHQADQVPEVNERFRGNLHKIYHNADGKPVVETYLLQGMGHAVPVDPGNREDQGGNLGRYAEDTDVYSSFYAARFWGLVPD